MWQATKTVMWSCMWCVHEQKRGWISLWTHTHTRTRAHMHAHTHARARTHARTHAHKHTRTHTCVHTHTRTCETKICVKFSSHHMKIKGCNCWQWPGLTGGKRAFLSTSMFGGWPCSYWQPIQIVNVPHVTVIICHNCRPYRIPVFIVIIAFSGWIVNVCQEAHVSLVLPHHSRQVTSSPYSNVTTFQSQCLGFEVLGHALSM